MTPTTLQALRRLLFFSPCEAAQWIGDPLAPVSEGDWLAWERGSAPAPALIAQRIGELVEWRATVLAATADSIRRQIIDSGGLPESVFIIWYEHLDDWLSMPSREALMWRPQQSVCAALASMFTTVRLVAFDREAYRTWLAGAADSEARRAEWASTVMP